jgi:hypothetical protein
MNQPKWRYFVFYKYGVLAEVRKGYEQRTMPVLSQARGGLGRIVPFLLGNID